MLDWDPKEQAGPSSLLGRVVVPGRWRGRHVGWDFNGLGVLSHTDRSETTCFCDFLPRAGQGDRHRCVLWGCQRHLHEHLLDCGVLGAVQNGEGKRCVSDQVLLIVEKKNSTFPKV